MTCPSPSGMSGTAQVGICSFWPPTPEGLDPTSLQPQEAGLPGYLRGQGCLAGFGSLCSSSEPPGRLRLLTFGAILPLRPSDGPQGPLPILRTGCGLQGKQFQNLRPLIPLSISYLGKLRRKMGRNLLKEPQQVRGRARSRKLFQIEAPSHPNPQPLGLLSHP